MIDVQYNSRVQTAFESIVQFISSCKNVMRKEKMAAMTRRLRKQAEDAEPYGLLEKEDT
jgi:hypothetical protein